MRFAPWRTAHYARPQSAHGRGLRTTCLDFFAGLLDRECAVDMLPRLQARVTRIIDALSTAAGSGVPILGMTYYDPLLGFWGLVPGGRTLARANQRVFTLLNAGLTTAYGDAGATVADVAATFRIDDFESTVVVPGRARIPVNVALTCRWTWFCEEVLRRRARGSDRLPEDRAHVRPGAQDASAVTGVADPQSRISGQTASQPATTG